jgi:hypothetical protein
MIHYHARQMVTTEQPGKERTGADRFAKSAKLGKYN